MSYKFETDAKSFEIEYEVTNTDKRHLSFWTMPIHAGITVMYKLPKDNTWLNLDSFAYDSPVTIKMSDLVEDDQLYQIMIYAPVFSTLSKLQINIPDENYAAKIDLLPERSIVVVGGSITYGNGCTTANNMFSNVLERRLDAQVYHINIDSRDYLKAIEKYYATENPPITDVAILEIDYFGQNESDVEEYLPKLINLLKKRCKYIVGWYAIPEEKSFKKIIAYNTIKSLIDDKFELLDLSFIYDENHRDMCVFNDWFINDTGNLFIYKALEKSIRRLTQWK